MGKPAQSSFRRTLFARILLLTIPVLLAGEYFVYQKARSGFLKTARQSLTESAILKGEDIQALTEMLQSNLVLASQIATQRLGQPGSLQPLLQEIAAGLPERVECLQITSVQTDSIEGSTCGQQVLQPLEQPSWEQIRTRELKPADVFISPAQPVSSPAAPAAPQQQLHLVFQAPVYDPQGGLRYTLSARVKLHRRPPEIRGSLTGYTVVINQDGQILTHPLADRVGHNIAQEPNAPVLKAVVESALAGKQQSLHLFEDAQGEWLAGYSAMKIPMHGKTQTWVVMAITPIANALYDLQDIKNVLVFLTLGLVAASLLATIYMTRDLAAPLEQLGRYALQIGDRISPDRAPKNFKIKELNQLAEVLDRMVHRLEERAEELETAWQEAQVANQLKSEFLATTSHEFRTPLNAIIGSVRLVIDGCCDDREEELEFLQQADDAAIYLLKIINDLLDISKIEAGKVELHLQPVSIPDLCQQCLRMIQPAADRKQIVLSQTVAPNLEKVSLDERRVRQMVINLLSNAVKFTPEGGQVTLRAWNGYGHQLEQENRPDHSPINPDTSYLCIEVADSGIGIPKERWHLLFRPFQQIDSSYTRKYEGTGLGLALTKRLAELHGGSMSFTSVLNEGSIFRLWLPTRGPEATRSHL
ncbi:MAG: hypothetical protein OHK0047_29190 [Leptolyngbyaceae cyanobacterium]